MTMKQLFMSIFFALFAVAAMAQNDGSACEKAIYVDSTLVQRVTAGTDYWFTANTEDLPLTVYFFPDQDTDVSPGIYVDFTCDPGVYEDENVKSIVDLALSMGMYFPLGAKLEKVEINGNVAYQATYERDMLELLAQLGVDYSIPIYVDFYSSSVSGTVQMSNIKTVTLCTDIHQRVEVQDTLYLQANKPGLVYFPVTEWKNKKMSFTWTGSTPIRAYLDTDCDFDTLTSEYTYKFANQVNGLYTQQIIENDIDNYIRDAEDGNMYVLFMAPEDGKVYVGDYVDHGSVTINTCIKNLKSTAIDFPTAEAGLAMAASIPTKSYRFEASTIQDKNIRLKWKTTENKLAVAYFANFCGFELKASDPDVLDTVHFVYSEQEQAMIADIPFERVNKIAKQNTDGWLFMQIYRQDAGTFWWDIYEVVQPDCDSKSILLQPNDSVYMPANYYNTSYKMPVDAWKDHAHTFTWRGNRKAYVFIADSCSFPLAPFNEHVGKYMEINPNQTLELDEDYMDYLVEEFADDKNNLYLRLRSDNEGYLVTHQIEKIVIDTIEITISACDSYEWKGTTYTESGTYEHHSQDTQGKQTHEILHLTINHSITIEFDQIACDSLNWNGMFLTQSGIYTYTTQTVQGCDSIEVLHLTINYSDTAEYTAETCDSYTWNDATYTTSGSYTFRTQTAQGCDSIEVLHLTINHSDTAEYSAEACDSYTWKDAIYTTSGIYTYSTQTAHGCDSIEVLYLTINYSDTVELDPVIATDSYIWHDVEYTKSGTYTYLAKTEQGCDLLEVLQLTINSSAGFENTIVADGDSAKLVMINQSLYIQVQGAKSTDYYDLTGRKVEIK